MKLTVATITTLTILLLALFAPSMAAHGSQDEVITLTANNTVDLRQPVNAESMSEIISRIQKLNSLPKSPVERLKNKLLDADPIYLFLYTPGGEVGAGLEMLEAAKGSRRPVHTITSFAASMGFQIAQSLGTRYILKSGTLMSHHAAGGVSGEFGGVPNTQLRSRLSYFERLVEIMDLQTVARTNGKQTLESYTKAYDHELWLAGDEAVQKGYADKVVTVRCDESLEGFVTKNSTVDTFLGALSARVQVAKCPLDSRPRMVDVTAPDGDDLAPAVVARVKADYDATFSDIKNHVIPLGASK